MSKSVLEKSLKINLGGLKANLPTLSSILRTKGLLSQELGWLEYYSQSGCLSGISLRAVTSHVIPRHPKTDSFYLIVLWETATLYLDDMPNVSEQPEPVPHPKYTFLHKN